ncbi:MAG: hypothetical protein AUJ25_02700 [Parcubacteria group bacterium CG1_02_37_13]|nr:MAG: hypothetical protein AUJ25_02700 [Parcubacteria group bacterium CG1_02_37_13]
MAKKLILTRGSEGVDRSSGPSEQIVYIDQEVKVVEVPEGIAIKRYNDKGEKNNKEKAEMFSTKAIGFGV